MLRHKAMLAVCWSTIIAACLGLAGVSAEKIIDGKEAIPHSRPYMAFLKIKRGEHFYSCGGFIIHRKFILSAAHCSGEHITALLGAHNRIEREKSWQEIPVQKIIVHEKYNKILENDIMLLKLQHKAIWTREVQRIKIPNTSVDIRPNTSCSVLGWGKTNNNGSSSDVLREVEVKVQDVCNCKAARKFNLTATAICARGTGIKGVCNGDSGGPLVCPVNSACLPKAVGIASFIYANEMKKCEDPNSDNVYVKVSAYLEWIRRNIKANP
ncbi:mast cell protease 1A-like [Polypterus senegalus]|uniref:mast cell protease 1A-like n=1 Tax=Polypterus senegalus TaxID=55291 RepID=UPI0019642081|nr:mast cell protease 1A-like [Polypterus senegalus]